MKFALIHRAPAVAGFEVDAYWNVGQGWYTKLTSLDRIIQGFIDVHGKDWLINHSGFAIKVAATQDEVDIVQFSGEYPVAEWFTDKGPDFWRKQRERVVNARNKRNRRARGLRR